MHSGKILMPRFRIQQLLTVSMYAPVILVIKAVKRVTKFYLFPVNFAIAIKKPRLAGADRLYLMKSFILALLIPVCGIAQEKLTLARTLEIAVENYGSIRAKRYHSEASKTLIELARRTNLPNVNLGLQQDFGTVNGQNGPLYGFGGLAAGSSGPALAEQNWNAGFGALYLTQVNWDVVTFGRNKKRVTVAEHTAQKDNEDLQQEIFRHKIKVAAAYINWVTAHQLTLSFTRNVQRADTVQQVAGVKARNGLVPGVDLSMAKADLANASITYSRALDQEQELLNRLIELMGVEPADYQPDLSLLEKIPSRPAFQGDLSQHPELRLYKSLIRLNEEQTALLKTQYYPAVSLAGVFQTRASGFGNGYIQDQNDFTSGYFSGINPTRVNYLLGLGLNWNFTQTYRLKKQVSAQELTGKALQSEYEMTDLRLQTQLKTAQNKWSNALAVYEQVPVQLTAARDAYLQKSALYKNGLTDQVSVSQALYALIRAETDRDIAISHIWNALLLQAAASGDFDLIENNL